MSPRDATLQAMREVASPVVAVALVLSSVFIPVALVSGIKGRLFQQFALTIAASVLISAFTALSLTPALTSLLLKPRHERRRGVFARAFGAFNRGFAWTTDRYVRGAGALARRVLVALAIVAAFGLLSALTARALPASFVPDEDVGYLFGHVELPDASSLQSTDA